MKNNLIIAELGSVHDGSFGNAINLIKLAASCGADCVKFQTHIANAESLPSAPNPSYFSEETRMDYFERTAFNFDQWKSLKRKSEKLGLIFLSSPFSLEAVDILEMLDVQIYKIPSGEVSNLPLLEKIAKLKKPVLLSSGMSNWNELDLAVSIFKKCNLTVMQCSSIYPCPPEDAGLNVLSEMQKRYNCRVGFSDHTIGLSASISAAALGAKIIEKHLTFSKSMYGSDAKHSMEPNDFKIFCKELKDTWKMLKNPVNKDSNQKYFEMKKIFQKSIVSACNIPKDSMIRLEHLAFKKPGDGIPASNYKNLIGRKTKIDIEKNKKINEKDLK
tara:strand:+ start:4323 stop:5312 length:990 start_codon:yes stop_codon:yes gene_type:complete